MSALALTVNGERVELEVEPRLHLADLLRERLNLTGTHLGCEQGACGACTVLLDGAPARSCLVFAGMCEGAEVRTIEDFDHDALMARLRDVFSREHGLQCGFCTPGMLMTSRDVVSRLPGADEARIRKELSGNLCRCTGYVGIVRAVTQVAAEQAAQPAPPVPAAPRAPVRVFAASDAAVQDSAVAASRDALEQTGALEPGWTRLSDSFAVPRPSQEVWAMFADLRRMATCMPGAELDEADQHALKGRMRVKLGPISAAFAGTATIERDEVRQRGVLSGAGGDGKGGSRARGRVVYQLVPEGGGTRVNLTLEFVLHGALAQFGRSGLVKEFVGRLVRQFADNLAASLGDAPASPVPAPKASLGAASMLWGVIWSRIKTWLRQA